jgi:hypothetical protein
LSEHALSVAGKNKNQPTGAENCSPAFAGRQVENSMKKLN